MPGVQGQEVLKILSSLRKLTSWLLVLIVERNKPKRERASPAGEFAQNQSLCQSKMVIDYFFKCHSKPYLISPRMPSGVPILLTQVVPQDIKAPQDFLVEDHLHD